LNQKKKEIGGPVQVFIWLVACNLRKKEKEKKEKKKSQLMSNYTSLPYTCHPRRKNNAEMHQMMQQKLDSITVVSHMHHLKIVKWLMRARHTSTTPFLCAQN